MNEALIRWVVVNSPAEGATYRVHLLLAIEANGRREVRVSQRDLAALARVDPGHVRRCVRALVDDGLVDVIEQPRGQTPALLRLSVRASGARASRAVDEQPMGAPDARANGDAPISKQLTIINTPEPKPSRTPRPHEPAARGIVERVWLAKDPRPAQPFVAIVKIAEALLAAGWADDDVYDAMVEAPTISTRWCEAQRARFVRADRTILHVGEPPSGPSFVADYDQSRPRAEPWVCAVGNEYCVNGNVDDPDRPAGVPVSRCACQTKGT